MTTDHILDMHRSLILLFAKKYIWWETPETAVQQPFRVLRIPEESCHLFRRKPATCSGRNLPGIPA